MGKVFLTDLRAYNEGNLIGKWVDMSTISSVSDLTRGINDILQSGHEEWFVTDYDEFPDLGEYPALDDLILVNNILKEYDYEVVEYYIGNYGVEYLDGLEDAYFGTWDNKEDMMYEIFEMSYPEVLKQLENASLDYFFDFEDWFRNQEASGYFDIVKTSVGYVVLTTV